MKRKIKYNLVGNSELGGFEYPIENELFENWDEDEDELIIVGNYNYGTPININTVIKYITSLKNKGATHLSIDYHDDHESILIEGLEIETLPTEGINEQEIKEIKQQITDLERYKLGHIKNAENCQSEIDKLKEKLNNG